MVVLPDPELPTSAVTLPAGAVNAVSVDLAGLRLRRVRRFGDCWLGLTLWRQLGLAEFWRQRLGHDRGGVDWSKVLTVLAHYAALAVQNAARQEALREAQERHAVAETFAAVGDIAANVLHHLNNKVGTIPVRIQGIQDKSKSALLADVYLAKNLEEIERSASEAMKAVRESLAHLHPIRLAPVDVAGCVAAAVEAAGLPQSVRVEIEELDHLPAVVAGQRSLTLVFTNLLENAVEAMGGKGTLTVTISRIADGRAEVSFADTGPGITAENLNKIFQPLFSTKAKGIGFGLSITKMIIDKHNGTIEAESEPGKETIITIKFPPYAGEDKEA